MREELAGLESQMAELDRQREALPERVRIRDLETVLGKQRQYRSSLGFLRRAEKQRIEEQICTLEQELADLRVSLENKEHDIEDGIADLTLAIRAIEEELERT